MQKTNSNPCVRCGKERIIVKTWQDYIGESLVTYTLGLCPDKECQKIVDKANIAREEKIAFHANKRNQLKLSRSKFTKAKASS